MILGDLLGRIFYILPPLPRTAQLAITNRCNFNCRMCQRHDLKVKLVDMDFAVYQKILDRLSGVKNLILTSWGEPLLHPDFIKMLELAKQKNFKTRFTTNGVLLSEPIMQAIIDNNVEAVTFSLDQLKNHDDSLGHEVAGQLEKIIKLKEKIVSAKSRTKIYLQSTYHCGREQDIIDVASFAASHRLDRLRLSRLDARFHDFKRPSLNDEKKLLRLLEQKFPAGRIGIDFLPHVAFDGWLKIAYKLMAPLLHRGGRFCLRTYEDVYIDADGEVTPCCGLPWLALGNILTDDLKEIWRGEKFKHFRRNQRLCCGSCDVLDLKPHNN
jgi:MoaA/NifB/PqqE/SkfB family radical SAM enzyme